MSSSTSGDAPELATLTTSYAYDPNRHLTITETPEGTGYAAILKDYDAFGRLSATYDPLSNVTASFTYLLNASGVSTDQVTAITTSDGITLANTYDGFLKKRTAWSSSSVAGSVNWTYDAFFRPATLQVSSAPAITFAYDLDSLYVGTSSPAFTVTRDQSGSSLDGLPYSSVLGTVSDAWTYDGFGAQSSYTVKTSDGTRVWCDHVLRFRMVPSTTRRAASAGMRRSSLSGVRPIIAGQPWSFHSASIRASVGWTGTWRTAPVFVRRRLFELAMRRRPSGFTPRRPRP